MDSFSSKGELCLKVSTKKRQTHEIQVTISKYKEETEIISLICHYHGLKSSHSFAISRGRIRKLILICLHKNVLALIITKKDDINLCCSLVYYYSKWQRKKEGISFYSFKIQGFSTWVTQNSTKKFR